VIRRDCDTGVETERVAAVVDDCDHVTGLPDQPDAVAGERRAGLLRGETARAEWALSEVAGPLLQHVAHARRIIEPYLVIVRHRREERCGERLRDEPISKSES
jgi:hypothetical protein